MEVQDIKSLTTLDRLYEQGSQPEWLVKGLLMRGGVTLLTGPSEAYKTFFAVDLTMGLASGRGSVGPLKAVPDPVKVLYIFSEAPASAAIRFKAWEQVNGKLSQSARESVWVFPKPVDLNQLGQVRQLIEEADPDVIVVDTLSANSGGADENSAKDMGQILATLRDMAGYTTYTERIGGRQLDPEMVWNEETQEWEYLPARDETELVVEASKPRAILVLHHGTKDAASAYRGHSSILNNTDIMVTLKRTQALRTTLRSDRQKDSGGFPPVNLDLLVVPVLDEAGKPMVDQWGDEVTTLVASYPEGQKRAEMPVIELLRERGPQTTKELAAALDISKNYVQVQVSRARSLGYVIGRTTNEEGEGAYELVEGPPEAEEVEAL